MRTIWALTAALGVFIYGAAAGVVWHVPGDYSTIQLGIDVASNGDTVLVADGTYIENIDFGGKAILVTSENGPNYTAIEMYLSAPVVTFNNGESRSSILSGFTIDGDSSSYGIYIYGTSPTIYNNLVKNHEVGIRIDNGGSPLIRKNEITLCSHTDYSPHNGGGIRMESAVYAVIDSNEIHHNFANVAGGIYLNNCTGVIVERNLIYSNGSIYIGGLEIAFSDSTKVYNNTLTGNSSSSPILGSINISHSEYVIAAGNISAFNNEYGICNYYSNANLTTRYNDVFGNSPENYFNWSPGAGSISEDPLFVDLANGDFNLDASSPCINAGDPYLPLDPDGSISDMGALYYPLGPLTYGSLAGTVSDTFGVPLQNVHISEPYYGHETWSDIDGNYQIDSLVVWGGYDILFSHPDFVDTTIYDVVITENNTTYLDVAMEPVPEPGAIRGLVTDASMNPIESVSVEIMNLMEAYTDINGIFILEDLYPDLYDLVVFHPDYVPQYYYDVPVASNDTTDLNITLYTYGAVAGVVSDTSGNPIENAVITDLASGKKDSTAADGEYFIDRLEPGSHNILFRHYFYSDTVIQDVMIFSSQTTYLDVTLHDIPECEYATGDVNFSGSFNILDPLYGVFYFRGIVDPIYTCECTPENVWYVEGDVNGSCSFIGSDITQMYNYLRNYADELTPCPDCPPAEPPSSDTRYQDIIANMDFDYNSPAVDPAAYEKTIPRDILLTDEGVELWFGNVDESPVDVLPGDQVEINVYVQMASDADVSCFNLPLGADNDYISGFLSQSLGRTYGMTDWDVKEFVLPDDSPPNPAGWSSQSLMASIDVTPPFDGEPLHYESPTLLGTFVLQTIDDPSFANQTVQCIGPGISRTGAAVFGDPTALIEHEVTQHFSPIHFMDPSGYAGTIAGTVTDNSQVPIPGVTVTVEGTSHYDLTDNGGTFMMEYVIAGTYDITLKHPLYNDTVLADIPIAINETTTVSVIMHDGLSNDITLMYGSVDGTPLSAAIGNRLYIDVYIQTGSDTYIDYFNIALGSKDQYFDSLLSENEGQFHDVIPEWDEATFLEAVGSPPNPFGWSAESAIGFREVVEPYGNPYLHCPTATRILTFVVTIPDDSSLVGDTVLCMGPGIGQFSIPTEFADTTGLPINDFAEYFSQILFVAEQLPGIITGTVTDSTHFPIQGVMVTVQGTGLQDTTDASGQYAFENVVPGIYDLFFYHQDYFPITIEDVEVVSEQTTVVDATLYEPTSDCIYVVGDVNNSGTYNGLDITYGTNFFKGGPAPLYTCECTPGNIWYVAGDVNNSCSYNGLDITYGVAYFKGGPAPAPCADCPPAE